MFSKIIIPLSHLRDEANTRSSEHLMQKKGARKSIPAPARNPKRAVLIYRRCVNLVQQVLKLGSAAIDSAFDGTHGEARDLCDLFVGELLNIS